MTTGPRRTIAAGVVVSLAVLGAVAAAAAAGVGKTASDLAETREVQLHAATKMKVKTDSSQAFTTAQSWSDMPGMSVHYAVSRRAAKDETALITLSAESNCQQNPKVSVFCWVRVLVDGLVVAPGQVIFDSVEHGPNSANVNSWGSHTAQWAVGPLTPGPHTVTVQYRVDEANATFWVDNRTLSVIGARHKRVDITP